MSSKLPLTTVILTLNEEENIARAIKSAMDISQEILVVDSGSVDNTVKVAESLGAKWVVQPFTNYSEQRNFALSLVKTEWVLFLDADEELSDGLKREIVFYLGTESSNYDGFLIPRKNWYLGNFLRCWSPDRLLRLFKTQKGCWVGKVHEKVKVEGKVALMKNPIYHYPFKNLYHQYSKNLRYAQIMAEEKFEKGRKFNIFDLKVRPFLNFLKHFLLKGCIFEGIRGFIFSLFYMQYTIQKYSMLYELWRTRGSKGKR